MNFETIGKGNVAHQVEVVMNGEIIKVMCSFKYLDRCIGKDESPSFDVRITLAEELMISAATKKFHFTSSAKLVMERE